MRFFFIFSTLLFLGLSCKKTAKTCDIPEPVCGDIYCVAHWDYFEFKLVDKQTQADLVFGENPRYNPGDVKIFFDANRTHPMNLTVDSTKKKLFVMTARDKMYLEIKGTDVYTLTAEFRGKDCCSSTVKTLWQNDRLICSCCDGPIPVPVN